MYWHGQFLKEIVTAKDTKVILELGVRTVDDDLNASSTFIFYKALERLHRRYPSSTPRVLYSCDMVEPAPHLARVPHKSAKLLKRLKRSENPVWEFFLGDDREQFLPIEECLNRKNQEVDILLIDTHKNYELTKFELENYSKLLSESGIILMHDLGINWKWNAITSSKYQRGAYDPKAVEEFKGHDRATMEFMNSTEFKIKIQLGSYNMAVLYRDISHLNGVEPQDLPYDNKRNQITEWQMLERRQSWDEIWGEYTDKENK